MNYMEKFLTKIGRLTSTKDIKGDILKEIENEVNSYDMIKNVSFVVNRTMLANHTSIIAIGMNTKKDTIEFTDVLHLKEDLKINLDLETLQNTIDVIYCVIGVDKLYTLNDIIGTEISLTELNTTNIMNTKTFCSHTLCKIVNVKDRYLIPFKLVYDEEWKIIVVGESFESLNDI